MSIVIKGTLKLYQETGKDEYFNTIYEYCLPTFQSWYRHVQRYTDLDRATLLSEFQYIVFRVARQFDISSTVPDGFIRYFRSAAKKQSITLRRESIKDMNVYPLRQEWDISDPKSVEDWECMEVNDLINTYFTGDELTFVNMKISGEQSSDIQSKMDLTEFQYRKLVRKVKSNRLLRMPLSRD